MMRLFQILGILIFVISIGCAGQQQAAQDDGFDASICNDVPVGIEAVVASDPETSAFKISCADLQKM